MIFKMLFSLVLIFGVSIRMLNSSSVIENQKINKDVLSETLFQSIKSDEKDLFIDKVSATQDLDSVKCLLDLREIKRQFPSLQAAPFLDSWGHLPSGILYGNVADFGNFDECLATSVTLSKLTGLVKGKYCLVNIPLPQNAGLRMDDVPAVFRSQIRNDPSYSMGIAIGICVPHSCSPKFLTSAIDLASKNVSDGSMKGISVSSCITSKKLDFKSGDIFAIIFYSLIAGLMMCSTVYEFVMAYCEKKPKPIFLTFSVITNGKKLFAINPASSSREISCLTGMRVISMIWVVYAHTAMFFVYVPKLNTIEAIQWLTRASSMYTLNATVSVDTFLFMSGLLVAWHGLHSLDRSKGRVNILAMYVFRYIRLTVPLAAVILFAGTLHKHVGTGPIRQLGSELFKCTYKSSWPILLYIDNYYEGSVKCLPQTWYLSLDFQLYLLSPFLLIPMWKWGRKFAPALVLMALLSIGYVMAVYIINDYTSLTGIATSEFNSKVYRPAHARCSPWLVGFGLGYFMHISRHRTIRLPNKILQLVGWIVSLSSMVAIVFGTYFSRKSLNGPTVLEAAMNESLKRVSWAIALSWITFACHFGLGGFVNTFLSHPIWQPFARLSYSLYLVHLSVIFIVFSSARNSMYFSDSSVTLTFWSVFGVSLVTCIPFILAFETPVLVLEKLALTKRAAGLTQAKSPSSSISSNEKVIDFPNKDEK